MAKKKKVLFTATVDSHIQNFHIPYLKMFKDSGYEVHVATNGDEEVLYCDVKHKVNFERSPFKYNNIKAISQMKKIIDEENFDVIHCHTPMGGVVTRIAAKDAMKKGTRVMYTAHGFHFFKGAPVINWMLFYPIEKYLSKYTDTLITINMEDYELAKKKFKAKQTEYVPGVGVDEAKFTFEMTDKEKEDLRKDVGIKKNDFAVMCIGELNKNKNQIMLLDAMKEIVKENKTIHLLLAGDGDLKDFYEEKIKEYGLEKNVHLLGYRRDIPKLLRIVSLVVSTSMREGLPVNLMEAMTEGVPMIATNCRGNRDLVIDRENGYIVEINDKLGLKESILKIYSSKELKEKYSTCCKKESTKYELDKIAKSMKKIYELDKKKGNK